MTTIGVPGGRSLGQAVAFRRQALKIDQTELARRTGWSRATVSRIERGLRGLVNRAELEMIAEALSTEPHLLSELAERQEALDAPVRDAVTLETVLDELADLRAAVARIEERLAAADQGTPPAEVLRGREAVEEMVEERLRSRSRRG
ncbi:MAG: helix-turn-helix transcriptional regulator [Miltoncostaeaceae bacterium]